MAWHRPGKKPLTEAMLVSLPMHIWVTRPEWVIRFNWLCPGNNYMLVVTLYEPILCESINGKWTHRNQLQWKTYQSTILFILKIAFKNFVFKVLSILFRHHHKIILDMDGALDTEQSTFSPIQQAFGANQSILIIYLPYTPKQWKMCKAE